VSDPLLTGCAESAARPETVKTASGPRTSITATSPSAGEEVELAAQAVVDFWAELDELARDPDRPIAMLSTVASGQAFAGWFELTPNMRAFGAQQTGTVFVRTVVPRYDAKADAYRVTTCIDVSGVDVRDKDGNSIVGKDREPRMEYTFVVAKVGHAFVVTEDSSVGVPC
jgi:hypothetical protein